MLKHIIVLALMLVPSLAYSYECSEEIDNLSKEYDIPIHCRLSSFEFMSKNVKGDEGTRQMIDDFYPSLNKFFSTYGKRFIKSSLDEIVILKNLKYYNNSVGGLSDGDKIYICLDDYSEFGGFRDNVYFKNLNHEFSSNVLRKAKYSKRIMWKYIAYVYDFSREFLIKCLNNPDFSKRVDDNLLNNGFLSNYSLTNEENDFNVYAEKLFAGDSLLLRAKNTYPKVREKLKLLKEIYRDLGYSGKFPDET